MGMHAILEKRMGDILQKEADDGEGNLRFSKIGQCNRALYFAYKRYKPRPLHILEYMKLKDGILHHNAIYDLFKQANINVYGVDDKPYIAGKNDECHLTYLGEITITGHIDGVVYVKLSESDIIEDFCTKEECAKQEKAGKFNIVKAVLEIKSQSEYPYLKKDGGEEIIDEYIMQGTGYCLSTNSYYIVFVIKNKNTSLIKDDILVKRVNMDMSKMLADKLEEVRQIIKLDQIPAMREDCKIMSGGKVDWRCTYCRYNQHCFPTGVLTVSNRGSLSFIVS